MSESPARAERRGWRRWAFPAALAVTLFLWMGGPSLLLTLASPWMVPLIAEPPSAAWHPELHRWHFTENAAVGLLIALPMVFLFRNPATKPVALQSAIAVRLLYVVPVLGAFRSQGLKGALALVFMAVWVVTGLLLVATYPDRLALLRLTRFSGRSAPLLLVTLLIAIPLGWDLWRNLAWEAAGVGGEHFLTGHWMFAAWLDLGLILSGAFASSGGPGSRVVAFATGVTLCYLGLAAALFLPDQAGSWGVEGGVLAIVAGLAYVGIPMA